jgi:hypothetical protein
LLLLLLPLLLPLPSAAFRADGRWFSLSTGILLLVVVEGLRAAVRVPLLLVVLRVWEAVVLLFISANASELERLVSHLMHSGASALFR